MDANRQQIDEEEVYMKFTAIEHASKQKKWIPWVVLFFGVLFLIIASILTGLHFKRSTPGFDPTCNATAERVLETTNLTEERDRLKQQNMEECGAQGWVYFGDSCYLGSTTEQSWNKSRELCLEKGADLIIITSTEEQEFARSTFSDRRWIGLHDFQEEGVWKWVDGSPLTTSFWRQGEPNDDGSGEDCAEIKNYAELRNWNDDNCAYKFKSICEKRII